MNQTSKKLDLSDFPKDHLVFLFSPTQLGELFGRDNAREIVSHFCRIDPCNPERLDVWVSNNGRHLVPISITKPPQWQPFSLQVLYFHNDTEYQQFALGTDENDARKVIQATFDADNLSVRKPTKKGPENLLVLSVKPALPNSIKRPPNTKALVVSKATYVEYFLQEPPTEVARRLAEGAGDHQN